MYYSLYIYQYIYTHIKMCVCAYADICMYVCIRTVSKPLYFYGHQILLFCI